MHAVLLTAGALLTGGVIGNYQYRWRLRSALRKAVDRHPAGPVEPPIDQDAMLRIIQQHQRPR